MDALDKKKEATCIGSLRGWLLTRSFVSERQASVCVHTTGKLVHPPFHEILIYWHSAQTLLKYTLMLLRFTR